MEYAHGALHWLAASAVNTVYYANNLSFQPKALKFYYNGLASTSNANTFSTTTNARAGIGFAVSTTERRNVTYFSQDAHSPAGNTACMKSNNCIAATITAAATVDGLLDLNSIDANGFSLIVDDATPVDITVFWEAWGGSDITVAVVGDIDEPTGITTTTDANVDYTVTGFDNNAGKDQCVMLAGCHASTLNNSALASAGGLFHGWATAAAEKDVDNPELVSAAFAITDNVAQSQASTSCGRDIRIGCYAVVARFASVTSPTAALTAFDTNKFTLRWFGQESLQNRRHIFMAIKGGRWKAGYTTIDCTLTNAKAYPTYPLDFDPIGFDIFSNFHYFSTDGTESRLKITENGTRNTMGETGGAEFGLGCAKSTTSRQSMYIVDTNGLSTSAVVLSLQFDSCMHHVVSGGARNIIDVTSFSKANVELNVDSSSTFAHPNMALGLLYFGTKEPTANQEGFRWRADDGSETTASWLAAQDTNINRSRNVATRLRVLNDTTSNVATSNARIQFKRSDEPDSEWRDV